MMNWRTHEDARIEQQAIAAHQEREELRDLALVELLAKAEFHARSLGQIRRHARERLQLTGGLK